MKFGIKGNRMLRTFENSEPQSGSSCKGNMWRERFSQSQKDNYMSGMMTDLKVLSIIMRKHEKSLLPGISVSSTPYQRTCRRALWWHRPMYRSKGRKERANGKLTPN